MLDPISEANERLMTGEAVPAGDIEAALEADREGRGGTEVTVEQCQAAIRGMVHELAPMLRADPPVPVEVWDPLRREWFKGQVEAWCGEMVHATYSTAPGAKHLVWVPADAVRRA